MSPSHPVTHRIAPRPWLLLIGALVALIAAGCGGGAASHSSGGATSTATNSGTATNALPGANRPPVTIGDKNFTEQMVLGELYTIALEAQGFTVQLNENIGPTAVTLENLRTGALDMYPEYLNTFNRTIADNARRYVSETAAYAAAQRYAGAHGLALLPATPFDDTPALGVTVGYAQGNGLNAVADLSRVQRSMIVGGPPEFQQLSPGLSDLQRNYGFDVHTFKSVGIGDQYAALNDGTIQVAYVKTTDGELNSGDYAVLADPHRTFGYGNVMPVVTRKALAAEGPDFALTVDRVSALLTTAVMRELNSEVDVAGKDPNLVARTFLETHGVIAPGS